MNYTNVKFGRLTITSFSHKRGKVSYYNCKCECGNEKPYQINNLKSGNTSSCGCLKKEVLSNQEDDKRSFNFDYDFFCEWSSDLAYILGLIASDGNVHKNRLRICLSTKDKELLERINIRISNERGILDTKVNLKGKSFEVSELIVYSKRLCKKLLEYGIHENKSLDINVPSIIPQKYLIHYIRGFFDGDGSVDINYPTNKFGIKTKKAQLRVRFGSASKEILEIFRDFLHANFNVKDRKIEARKSGKFFELAYSTFDSIKIYEAFYSDDCDLFMKRKKEIFKLGLNERGIL